MRYLSNGHNGKVLELHGKRKTEISLELWLDEGSGRRTVGKHGTEQDVWRHVESVDLVMEGL